jgi:hypothetical protein
VVSFGTRFSSALSDIVFLLFLIVLDHPPPPVDRFVSYTDVIRVDADFLSYQGLLE